jgi:hypothetical protein
MQKWSDDSSMSSKYLQDARPAAAYALQVIAAGLQHCQHCTSTAHTASLASGRLWLPQLRVWHYIGCVGFFVSPTIPCLSPLLACWFVCCVWLFCVGLCALEEQLWLSRLSQAPAVHLIASIDHVNAALLWDNRTAAAFKWLWLDVTSYAAYKSETSNALPILTSECPVCYMAVSRYDMCHAWMRTSRQQLS